MLKLYTSWSLVPSNVKVIMDNRDFFMSNTLNRLDNILNGLTKRSDNAIYLNGVRFIDRYEFHVLWNGLSTGGMTTLNMFYYPDLCFNLAECGSNALKDILLLPNGIDCNEDILCDICINGDMSYIYKSIRELMGDSEYD